jgi:hypothetical protein
VERVEIRKNTELMQCSDDPLWVRIRHLIKEKGLVPETSVLAYSYPEDLHFELGVIVTADRKVYQYGFDYLHRDISTGTFTEWKDLTANYEKSAFSSHIENALLVAGELSGS